MKPSNVLLDRDDLPALDEVFAHLIERGDLVQIAEDIFYHREKYDEATTRVVASFARTGFLSSAAFKDELGTSRKYAIPLLEHFDEIGLTVREGDGRVLRKPV